MIFEQWKPIYEEILKDFDFDEKLDIKAGFLLDQYLDKKDSYKLENLKYKIERKEIYIFGAGPSLEHSLIKYKEKFENNTIISADGATSALIEIGIIPDIIVTDLDGKISDQNHANLIGSLLIVHAHGDNIDRIKENISIFNGKLFGTTQVNPSLYRNLHNFGGFTDGDRAIFLAEHFKSKNIFLIGFDFDGVIGKYSFSEKKNKNIKLKKLQWCKKLIDILIKNGTKIKYLE